MDGTGTPTTPGPSTEITITATDKTTGSPVTFVLSLTATSTPVLRGRELYGGTAGVTKSLRKRGWVMDEEFDERTKLLTTDPTEWTPLAKQMADGRYASMHVAFVCTNAGNYARINNTPEEYAAKQATAAQEIEPVLTALTEHIKQGGHVTIENPKVSTLWVTEYFRRFAAENYMYPTELDMCRYPRPGWERAKKSTIVYSNLPRDIMDKMSLKCDCTSPHRLLSGTMPHPETGKITAATKVYEEYSPAFADALADAHHEAALRQLLENVRSRLQATIQEIGRPEQPKPAGFNIIDTGADLPFVNVGEATGAWRVQEPLGSINTTGYDGSTTTRPVQAVTTVVTTQAGTNIVILASKAVTHTDSTLSSLTDPFAMAAAGWDIAINFKAGTGTATKGDHAITLTVLGSSLGFFSKAPTVHDIANLEHVELVPRQYDKKEFLSDTGMTQALRREAQALRHKNKAKALPREAYALIKLTPFLPLPTHPPTAATSLRPITVITPTTPAVPATSVRPPWEPGDKPGRKWVPSQYWDRIWSTTRPTDPRDGVNQLPAIQRLTINQIRTMAEGLPPDGAPETIDERIWETAALRVMSETSKGSDLADMQILLDRETENPTELKAFSTSPPAIHDDLARLGYCNRQQANATKKCTTWRFADTTTDPTRVRRRTDFTGGQRRNILVGTDTITVADLVPNTNPAYEPGGPAPINTTSSKLKRKYAHHVGSTALCPFKYLQLFVELGLTSKADSSKYLVAVPMKRKGDFPEALVDYIRERGIPDRFCHDGDNVEHSEAVKQIYRRYNIGAPRISEPSLQFQNPAEVVGVRRFMTAYRTIAMWTVARYDFVLPQAHWPYMAAYVVTVLNWRASATGTGIGAGMTPAEKANGVTPDLSALRFAFCEPVLYSTNAPFPESRVRAGYCLGPCPFGNRLTQWILTEGGTVIARSAIVSRAEFIKSSKPATVRGETDDTATRMEGLADDLDQFDEPATEEVENQARKEYETLHRQLQELKKSNTERRIAIDLKRQKMSPNDSPGSDSEDGSTSGSESSDESTDDEIEEFEEIQGYVGGTRQKLRPADHNSRYTTKGQLWLKIGWKEGDVTHEPFAEVCKTAPKETAAFMEKTFTPEMRRLNKNANVTKALRWLDNYTAATKNADKKVTPARIQELNVSGYFDDTNKCSDIEAELRGEAREPTGAGEIDTEPTISLNKLGVDENADWQNGERRPRTSKEAATIEAETGAKWAAAAHQECVEKLIDKYDCLELGEPGALCPSGYQEIGFKIVYTVTADGTRKARACAVGCNVDSGNINRHLTVVDIAAARMVMTAALADDMELTVLDVKSAYCLCRAEEQTWCKSLPAEFGEHAGKSAKLTGNIYGLNSAGATWAKALNKQLLALGFKRSRHDRAVYYREVETLAGLRYERICTFVDDLILASPRMTELEDEIRGCYELKHATNMGKGLLYTGADCKHDRSANTVEISARTYIEEAISHIERKGDTNRTKAESQRGVRKIFDMPHEMRPDKGPMKEEDHHELLEGEEAVFLSPGERLTYQSLIGAANWVLTLARIDIGYAVPALQSYNATPRRGHAKRLMRIWGYLKAHPKRGIVLQYNNTTLEGTVASEVTVEPHHREHLIESYGAGADGVSDQELEEGDPKPLGAALSLCGYCDSDHAHNTIDRRSTTGWILLLAGSPVGWKSRRQVGCENSSYGAELRCMASAARELRGGRRFLMGIGVPLLGPSLLFGDNMSAITAATNLGTPLKAKHLGLDYCTLRELTAWGIIQPQKIHSYWNLADILTKPVDRVTFQRLVDILLSRPGPGSERRTVAAVETLGKMVSIRRMLV
jgi:hypothetical protein